MLSRMRTTSFNFFQSRQNIRSLWGKYIQHEYVFLKTLNGMWYITRNVSQFTGSKDALFAPNCESHSTLEHDTKLFRRMLVRSAFEVWERFVQAEHRVVPKNALPRHAGG